jgi:hypothetical protein
MIYSEIFPRTMSRPLLLLDLPRDVLLYHVMTKHLSYSALCMFSMVCRRIHAMRRLVKGRDTRYHPDHLLEVVAEEGLVELFLKLLQAGWRVDCRHPQYIAAVARKCKTIVYTGHLFYHVVLRKHWDLFRTVLQTVVKLPHSDFRLEADTIMEAAISSKEVCLVDCVLHTLGRTFGRNNYYGKLAARLGAVSILELLFKYDICQWTGITKQAASSPAGIPVLEYRRKRRYTRMSPAASTMAAWRNQLEVLQYLHKHDVLCYAAALRSAQQRPPRNQCYQWLITHFSGECCACRPI